MRADYINKIKGAAIIACKGTGLFPSLMIAQGILESGEGRSLLAAKFNNHFGIKASGSWSGKIAALPTTEYVNGKAVKVTANFRSYGTLDEGFKDRVKFLQVNPRYAKNGVFIAKTPEEQAQAFQRAGYATDPNYAKLLIQILNGSSNLKQYDKP